MRAPPPTSLTIAPHAAWRWARAGLAGLAAAALAAWSAAVFWEASEGLQLFCGAVAGAASALCVAARLRDPMGLLRWTGSRWEWLQRDAQPQEILQADVMIDLHLWMLLRLKRRAGAAVWLACRASADSPSWPAFRAAVYSRASRSPGPPETEPPRS